MRAWESPDGFPVTVQAARAAGIPAGRDEVTAGPPTLAWEDAGLVGPPAPGTWGPDVLGSGFRALTIELAEDDEGPVVATLIGHDPTTDPYFTESAGAATAKPSFLLLYLHGWNDHFFQRHLARFVAEIGGAFFALDLRKYGRSWREHQSFGYVDDLSIYDEEINRALAMMRAEHGFELPLFLMGHSTGGLTTALWAHRHPGALSGLILNSPWLEFAAAPSTREIATPLVSLVAGRAPLRVISVGSGADFHGRSLDGWDEADGELPPHLRDFPDDPAVSGWYLHPRWKHRPGAPTRSGWLNAVMTGHQQVAAGLSIDCPILFQTATQSWTGSEWDPIIRRQDAVLDSDNQARRAGNLGSCVLLWRDETRHDVMLSDPEVRSRVLDVLRRWVAGVLETPPRAHLR